MTLANEKHLYCGKTDVPLSETGKNLLLQKKNARYYPDISHCVLYTSGLQRANQTLALLYPELSPSAREEPAFQEFNFGDFEMHSYNELMHNQDYQNWLQHEVARHNGKNEGADRFSCPNGESWKDFKTRVLLALEKIMNLHHSVAVFTHGGIIAVIMEHFFPNEQKSLYEWQDDFGSVFKITYDANGAILER